MTNKRKLGGGASWYPPDHPKHKPGLDFTRLAGKQSTGEMWAELAAKSGELYGIPLWQKEFGLPGEPDPHLKTVQGQNSPQLWKDRQGGHFDGSYGLKLPGNNSERRWEDREVKRLRDAGVKAPGNDTFAKDGRPCNKLTDPRYGSGTKQSGISGPRDNGKGDRWFQDGAARSGSKSNASKQASAQIAMIPFALSRHVARVYKPEGR